MSLFTVLYLGELLSYLARLMTLPRLVSHLAKGMGAPALKESWRENPGVAKPVPARTDALPAERGCRPFICVLFMALSCEW